MTKEELKNKLISEAQDNWVKLDIHKRVCGSEFSYYDGYIDCGTIKEKQIQIDAEQIRALQKQNGELTDELKLTNNECKDMRDELKQRIRENQKLCEQIEKMKCCENCKYNSYWGNELHCNYGLKEALQEDKLVECKNMDKWEIKEK